MIHGLGSSISGMRAASTKLDVSAHNTANISTDGFKKQRVNLSEAKNGGVTTSIETINDPGPSYFSPGGAIVEASNVDLVEELVDQRIASHAFKANAAAFKTADEMQESLLDILA
jgi:flagellar basal-body rod protein FlgC